ncbi:MAG TPA: hypothetical protein VF668_08850 [Pyrinomonadaceae bacterium]
MRLSGLTRLAALCVPLLLCAAGAGAQTQPARTVRTLRLGETAVKVNVYERAGAAVTFFSPHHNEAAGREAAKEALAARGGRFVEVEALDEAGAPARRLRFRAGGKPFSVDPNRVFTPNGRRCLSLPPDAEAAVKAFADELLELLFAPGGRRLREGETVFVAVHNNGDVEARPAPERDGDLTAVGFVRPLRSRAAFRGEFEESAAGVYLSNAEADEDNFIVVTAPGLLGHFAARGFNVIVQKPAAQLRGERCSLDDGSLSVHAAYNDIPYLNLEADAAAGGARQRQMLRAVYDLLDRTTAPRD